MSVLKCDLSLKEFSGVKQFSLAVKGDITWNSFCRALRNGVRSFSNVDEKETPEGDGNISINHHARMLEMIRFGLVHDNPAHIVFPGQKDSFIQMSAEFTCPRAFTVCMWLKIDEDTSMKGFLLCRCRSPTGGLDVILSERQTDGKWLVTIEGSADGPNFSSAASNFEVKGSAYISHGKWHLLSVRHQSGYVRGPKVSFVVDGNLEFENELPYPFLNSTVESQWLFGLRFKGLLASASLYPEEVSLPLLTLLYNKGSHMHSLTHGVVGTPQASFDTGHVILGTQIAKGPLAIDACRTVPAFCFTANHFFPLSNLPQCPPGRQNVDHIEMTPRLTEDSSTEGNLLLPSMTGGCRLSTKDGDSSSHGWAESWLTAGGCPLLLYLLQEYVRAVPSSSDMNATKTTENDPPDVIALVKQTICLLATLIEASAELKEQFIQIHGFHVVSTCLSQLQDKRALISTDIVDCCIELTLSLGLDALKGDGIAAALQGLLLDFRVWGGSSDAVKLYLLNSIANVVASTGDQLYSNVGLQRLLDVFRLHICPSNPEYGSVSSVPSDLGSSVPTDASNAESADLKRECANACARLLTIAVDAGLVMALKGSSTTPFYNDAEVLHACLEETSNCLLAERILRVLAGLRTAAPAALLHAMVETRFAETTAIGLLTNPNFTTEIRKETITNILWALGEQLKHIPQQLALARRAANGNGNARSQTRRFISNANRRSYSDMPQPQNSALEKGPYSKEALGQQALRALIRPLERAWLITSMLAEVIGKAIKDGCWRDKGRSKGSGDGYKSSASTVGDVLIAFSHDGPLGTVHTWLVLPMLPILFTHGNFRCNLRALMSLNVLLKTDDTQCVALTSLPDRAWVRLFVSIALTGERGRQQSLLKAKEMKEKVEAKEAADITEDYSVVDVRDKSSLNVFIADEENWALEAEIAATVTELALDAASTVIEGKMRHNGSDSWSTWNCLQNCLKTGCRSFQEDSEAMEISFLKRCVSVVIQRLARSSEAWTADTLKGVTNILTFVENRKLCGTSLHVSRRFKKPPSLKGPKIISVPTVPLDAVAKLSATDTESLAEHGIAAQNKDELHIMSFLTDLMCSLRKSIERNGAVGEELTALKIGFNIILGCLSNTSEVGAEKLSTEIFDHLSFMSEAYSCCSAEAFKEFVMLIFCNLQESMNDPSVPEELTGRYSALVYLIMHHFLEIRHKIASGVNVSAHVLPALDALAGVDTAKDVKLIFRLLEVCMRTADPISFADVSTDEMDGTAENGLDNSGNTMVSNTNGGAEDIDFSPGKAGQSLAESPVPQVWKNSGGSSSVNPDNSPLPDDGDSLHGLDILMVEMDEFSANMFDESDCDTDCRPSSISPPFKPSEKSDSVLSLTPGKVALIPPDKIKSKATEDVNADLAVDAESAAGGLEVEVSEDGLGSDAVGGEGTLEGSDSSLSPPSVSEILSPMMLPVPSSHGHPKDLSSATPRNKAFYDWVKIRRGLSLVRMDTERARLARTAEALDLAAEATNKFWIKLVRKVESECFNDVHDCQWKLGVSHESFFPGRKRVVLRPRFDFNPEAPNPEDEDEVRERVENVDCDEKVVDDEFKALDAPFGDFGEVKAALAKALGNLINDITQSGPTDSLYIATSTPGVDGSKALASDMDTSPGERSPKIETPIVKGTAPGVNSVSISPVPVVAPGCGWGLVDADGSDEGYDVVGLEMDDHARAPSRDMEHNISGDCKADYTEGAAANSGTASHGATRPHATAVSTNNDRMGDVRLVEAQLKDGKDAVETGPCHSGTKKAGSGPTILRSRVIMVTASGNFWGSLSFNGREVFFTSSFEPEDGHKDDNAAVNLVQQLRMRRRRWTLSSVCAIYLRRYRLRDTAMEIFFRRGKHRNFFVDFGHTREDERHRQAFARALMDVAPGGCFKQWPSMSPFRLVPELGVQEKWVSGRMSNFDYLMALNTISGRSFNDLCQYPVMPWILSQYENDTIDLNDPASYRDLSKPVGALNDARLKDFLERFNSFGEQLSSGGSSVGNSVGSGCRDSIPAFMYGSHYSTMMGVVLHFLVRLQPFASLHREMQSGHFDVPDRLFSSIPRSFKHNTTQLSEVKELTPEWFTTPEMFRNVNNFDFGQTQDGDAVGDVMLPPWAASAEEFVRINREAMESDYVSDHLQEWIDLIFGYKQRGPAAVEANNVFYYLTYSGSVNRDVIINESLRRATELQIAHFGQIPMQLFRTPHPPKRTCGSMGNGSIAGAMYSTPRPLRKSFATPIAPIVTPLPSPTIVISDIITQKSDIPELKSDLSSQSMEESLTKPTTDKEKLPVYALSFPENDEEAVAVESQCTLVLRPFAQPVIVSPPGRLLTVPSPWGTGRCGAFEFLGASYVPPSTILSLCILPDRLLVVLGTGVVEAYRYYTSDAAKSVLAMTTALPPANRRTYTTQRRRNAVELAKRLKLQKIAKAQALALLGSSALERDLPNRPMISFAEEVSAAPDTSNAKPSDPKGTETNPSSVPDPARSDPFADTPGGGVTTENKNKNSALRGTLQTSSTPTKVDSHDRLDPPREIAVVVPVAVDVTEKVSPRGTVVSPPTPTSNRRILSRKEPLVCVERDSSHFDVLPRLPLTKLLLCRPGQAPNPPPPPPAPPLSHSSSSSSSNSILRLPGLPASKAATQSTSLYALEQAAGLIVFSRSGRLALSGGRVDGSIAVREVDPRTGFILSAADFHAHHHRVICIAADSIAFARTDVIASCDAYGQTFVWTVSRLKSQSQASGISCYVISRRPQRLFRCQPSQHMRCEISWQLGLVVVVSLGVVHTFSVERDERLRAFEYDWEEDQMNCIAKKEDKAVDANVDAKTGDADRAVIVEPASGSHTECTSEGSQDPGSLSEVGSFEFETNKKDFNSSDKTNTTGRSNTYKKRPVRKNCPKSSSCAANDDVDAGEECSVARRVALCDDGTIVLHVEVFSERSEESASIPLPAAVSAPGSDGNKPSAHYILSYSLSGVRTGRVQASSPITFLSVPDKSSDVAFSGQENGAVTIYRASDLTVLYSFFPHLESTPQPQTTTSFPNPFLGPISPSNPNANNSKSSSPNGSSSGTDGNLNNAILCVRAGPSPETPSVLCISAASGALYIRPLPDFVRWERTRIPSALSQLVNAPIQAVRGTIQHAQTYAAEAAGVMAENAKMFVAEKMEKMNKSKVLKFFGFGSK